MCHTECPENTKENNGDHICKDDINKCLLSENEFYILSENITDEDVEKIAGKYALEFQYTNNHISLFKNSQYRITLYKNGVCISDLSLKVTEVDFKACYEKVKQKYQINNNLVIAVVEKVVEDADYHKMISYAMYDPVDGKSLPADDLCKDEKVIVKENLEGKLNETNIDMDSLRHLAGQNIDIFNLSSPFYTDLCYHYISTINKDVALKDRIFLYFPNITLCDEGCEIIGVNATTLNAMCECNFTTHKESIDNIISKNVIYQSQIGQFEEIISIVNGIALF
jgi:hypothetical protein